MIELGDAVRAAHLLDRSPRREDPRLLTGQATFVADVELADPLDIAFVRSPLAHARIGAIDTAAATAAPGVARVVTAADLKGMSAVPDTAAFIRPVHRFPLATDRVRYVGSPVVAVAATDRYLAEDAAELVEVTYDELPVLASMTDALADDAPRLYDDWPDNKLVDTSRPTPEIDEIFARSKVIRGKYRMHRHAPMPLETRGAAAEFRRGRLTVWTSTQVPHQERTILSRILGLSETDIQVIAPDVGGGFGGKLQLYPEDAVVAWLAMHSGRPTRWIEDRREHLIASSHARDEEVEIEGAVDAEGHLVALRARLLVNMGSGEIYPPGSAPAFVSASSLTSVYRIPVAAAIVTCVVTNTTPSGAYRGFGTPEMIFAVERFLDRVARETGQDPIRMRRDMVIRPEDLPYETPAGRKIDSGSHLAAFDEAVAWGKRTAEAHRETATGRVGVGYASYLDGVACTYFPNTNMWTGYETSTVRIEPDGRVVVAGGVSPSGQGLETMIATVTARELGVPLDQVVVRLGDTDLAPYGIGSQASRSTVVAAGAIMGSTTRLRAKVLTIAAHLLEADATDLVIEDGRIHVRGVSDRAVTIADVAGVAHLATFKLPPGTEPGLEASFSWDPPGTDNFPNERGRMNACLTWGNSCHAAVVEVDESTGEVRILDYLSVHDAGPIINPLIVEGQVQGGIAQGIGGVLYEQLAYSPDGQPLVTSFMDYLMPTAMEIPHITLTHMSSPSPKTPFGLKGVGEAGVTGPYAAIANAVCDALSDLGIDIVETPISGSAVRRLIREAAASGASSATSAT